MSGLQRIKQNDITPETMQQFNELVSNSGLAGVSDVNSLERMINTYQSILVKDKEINQLIDMLENAEIQAEQMQKQAAASGASGGTAPTGASPTTQPTTAQPQ